MNVTETSAEGLKREFKITVPAGELEDQISRRLGELGRSIRIPGFRPGKAPLNLLREMPEPDSAGLGLEKLAVAVPEEEIDRALERMAESQRKSEPVERPAENGDIGVVDFVRRIGD